MTSVRSFADLNDKLSRSVAINAVKQMIDMVDARLEASMGEIAQLKKLLEKLETYERSES